MPPNNQAQPNTGKMSADEAASNLGFATQLSQQMMPQGQQAVPVPSNNAPQTPQNAPGQEQTPNPQEGIKQLESRLMDEIGGIKDMIEKNAPKDKNKELDDLKKQIEDVLKESDEPK